MPSTYCPHCAAKIDYSGLTKPVMCPKCQKMMSKAFEVVSSYAPTTFKSGVSKVSKPSAKKVYTETMDDNEEVDNNELDSLKSEIMASLGGGLTIAEVKNDDKIMFEDLVNQ